MKPLFIPLKTEYFEAFKNGTKCVEYRRAGKRWNAQTCVIGRPVVLSKGYGRQHRLAGTVIGFYTRWESSRAWCDCYGAPGMAACIGIEVNG
jgi:hypothetical protein